MKEKNSRAGPLPQGKKGLEWRKDSPLVRGLSRLFHPVPSRERGPSRGGWSEVTRSR